VTACGTPEQNAWGLPREDVREIARLVRATHPRRYCLISATRLTTLLFSFSREGMSILTFTRQSGSLADGRSMKQ
jgi:hypothetical protein